MASKWRELTLGEFVRLQRGHDLTAAEQKPGLVPVMGSAGPNGTHAEARASGPGVVIGRSGASMGRVHYCEKDYWPHNTCLYVTDFLGNAPLFVYYKLAELDLARYNSGSAQPSLNRNYIYGMRLSVPEPRIQNRIAKTISGFDKKIDLNRRINQTLEAMAQAIFKSWFVDFDPVKAKIAAKERWLAQHPSPFGRGAGGEGKLPPPLLTFARDNRRNATDAESLMWRLLRGRQLGTKFRRQHPIASYILDFYCHEHRLAIELDGGQHYTPDGLAADAARTEILKQHGITVMRFSNREVLLETEAALEKIWRALTPTPLPEGEGLETVMLRAAMSAISGKSDAELDQLKTLPSPSGRGAGGEGEQLSAYDDLAATAALFPDEMEASELGEIPRGWEVKAVIDTASFATGKVDVSALSSDNYISTENMLENRGGVNYATSLPAVATVPSFSKGQVLISNIRPYFKKIWLARFNGGRSADVLAFNSTDKDCTEFLYNLLYQDEFFEFMMRTSKGAKMPRGDKDAIARWKFSCADHALRSLFSEEVRPYYLYIESLNAEAQRLSALRDTLLPKLLSGELPVAGLNSNLDEATQ